jgi:glucose/arabinose dehydrogenase
MRILKVVPALALVAGLAVPATAAAESVSVVASGIDNPRSLALGRDGTIYVASAGKAGTQCSGEGERQQCAGFTGGVVAVKDGAKRVVASGLASIGGRDGTFAVGLHGVTVGAGGSVFAVETSATPEQVRAMPAPLRAQAGRVFDVTGGELRPFADVSAFEWANNADRVRNDRNSNPYALLAAGDRTLVVDAGANSVLEVRDGRVSLLAVIPKNGRAQAVPTSIAAGPDGAYYVGELAEAAGAGKARVWRIPAAGGTPTVHATGFTAISGLAFGPDGSLFVTEFVRNPRDRRMRGDVVRVAPDGTRTRLGVGRLVAPTGAVVSPSGNVYVSNNSVLPARTPKSGPFGGAGGQVVRITP